MEKQQLYDLLIVDDDIHIRNGLADIVDWQACGFRVADTLSDGSEAMRYLRSKSADVVLTDIRMYSVSGLELAEYIHREHPHTLVVLISGYQEFGFAKEAVRYQVFDYLLKPTDLDELYRVFGLLRERLDKERLELREAGRKEEIWKQVVRYLKERHLPRLLFHAAAEPSEVGEILAFAGISAQALRNPCLVARWSFADSREEENSFRYEALNRILSEPASVTVIMNAMPGQPSMFLLLFSGVSRDRLQEAANERLRQVNETLRSITGMEISWTVEDSYDSLEAFLQKDGSGVAAGDTSDEDASVRSMLDNLQKGNAAAAEQLLQSIIGGEDGSGKERKVIGEAKEYIRSRLGFELTLAEVAEQVHLNPFYFSRLFKRETGSNFSDYVTALRLSEAASLLRSSHLKIYEIADKVGYRDVRHFYKLFKNSYGCTPKEYRENGS